MKRKVLISVLTVALVLTLCIGLFVACDKTPEEPATQYKVTFSLGEYTGADAAPAEKTVDAGSKIQLPAVGVTWADHTFLGWQLNGEGETLAANAEVTVNSDLNYIAKWQEDAEPLPKVTIYYTLGTELKNVVKDVMTTENEGKYMLNEPRNYIPDAEQEDFLAQLGKAEKYNYYYYDAAATDHKGQAFDFTTDFEATADFAIIIIKESFGTPAYTIDTEWYGYFTAPNNRGDQDYTLEISEDESGKITLDLTGGGPGAPITASIASGQMANDPMIYMTSDGSQLILLEKESSGAYNYYFISKGTDGKLTVTNDASTFTFSPAEKPGPAVTATIYYLMDDELKSAPAGIMASGDAYELSEMPEDYIPEEDKETFMAGLKYGTELKYYVYDAEKEDYKGEEFDPMDTFTESVSIFVTIETFATKAYTLDEKFEGIYTGTCDSWGAFTLTINCVGTIKLDYGTDESDPNPVEASFADGTILATTDGKLVFAEGSVKYAHYYYVTEKEGAYTLDSEYYTAVALTKKHVTATIYYMLDDTLKHTTAEADLADDGKYELFDLPEDYIPEEDSETFMAGLKYGTELKYYLYNAEAADHKGADLDPADTFADDISIFLTFETFATPTYSFDEKFEGIYTGTCDSWGAFTLTINCVGTIKLDYGTDESDPNPIEASLEDGTILTTTDGKLVFAEGSVQYAHYYFVTEKDGAYTLDSEYYTAVSLTKQHVYATIYYSVKGETKSTKAEAVLADDGKYELFDLPEDYLPAEDAEEFAKNYVFGSELKYYYYAEEQKGDEFDAFDTFESDITILVEYTKFATPAYMIDEKYDGKFTGTLQNKAFTLIINSTEGTIKLDYGAAEGAPSNIECSFAKESILTTNDRKLVFFEGAEPKYAHYYYIFEKEGALTLDCDYGKGIELTEQKVIATIYYMLDGELKSTTAEALVAGDNEFMLSESPEWYIPEDGGAYDTFMEALVYGAQLKYYNYDSAKEDHKGTEFNLDENFSSNVSIYVEIETFATPASVFDVKFEGIYTGTCEPWGEFTLTIIASSGTIRLDYGEDESDPNPVEASIADGTILTTTDGKLVFAEGSVQYAHYYFVTEKEGAYTLDSEYYTAVSLTKQHVYATIYYTLNGETKSIKQEAGLAEDGTYALSEMPEWYIPEDGGDYNNFMAGYKYGTELKYYLYDAEKEDHKGEEFDAHEGTFTKDISILVTFETFATPAESIDEKFNGTFGGACELWGGFLLTIDSEAGTIKLDYGEDESDPNPVEASIEGGTILTTTDGKLVFVEESPTENVAYAHYYYITEKEGAYTLDSEYYQNITIKTELTITFSGYNDYLKKVTVKAGETVAVPEDFPMEHVSNRTWLHHFSKISAYDTNNSYDFSTPVTNDFTLYGNYWASISFSLGDCETGTAPERMFGTGAYNAGGGNKAPALGDDVVWEKHKFLGWAKKGDSSGKLLQPGEDFPYTYENTEYVAQWKELKDNYTITFKADGETVETLTIALHGSITASDKAPEFAKNGNHFKYWALEGETTEFKFEGVEVEDDLVFDAYYVVHITFDLGEGAKEENPAPIDGQTSSSCEVGELPEGPFTNNKNQKFVGWRSPEMDGKFYLPGEDYDKAGKSFAFEAVWIEEGAKFTITYKAGDNGTGEELVKEYDQYSTVKLLTLEEAGFKAKSENCPYFRYWNVEGGLYQYAETEIVLEKNLVLTAYFDGEIWATIDAGSYTAAELMINLADSNKSGALYYYKNAYDEGTEYELTYAIDGTTLTITIGGNTFTGTVDKDNEEINIVLINDFMVYAFGDAEYQFEPLYGMYINQSDATKKLVFQYDPDYGPYLDEWYSTAQYEAYDGIYLQLPDKSYIAKVNSDTFTITVNEDGSLTVVCTDAKLSGTYTLASCELELGTYEYSFLSYKYKVTFKEDNIVDYNDGTAGIYYRSGDNYYTVITEDGDLFVFLVRTNGDLFCSSSSEFMAEDGVFEKAESTDTEFEQTELNGTYVNAVFATYSFVFTSDWTMTIKGYDKDIVCTYEQTAKDTYVATDDDGNKYTITYDSSENTLFAICDYDDLHLGGTYNFQEA